MAKKGDTGEGVEYTDAETEAAYDAMEDALIDWEKGARGSGGANPSAMWVSAQIEWSGAIEPANGGQRKTTVDGVNLGPALDAAREARQASRAAETARQRERESGPLKSYKAKGWQAQLNQLTGTKRGREALAGAGFTPSRETLRRWGRGDQAPGRANRAKIADAYEAARNPHATQARAADAQAAEARRTAVARLTDALRDRYGVAIRFRDIRGMKFHP